MNKTFSVLCVALLMVGCGKDGVEEQDSADKAKEEIEAKERELATLIPKAPAVDEEELTSVLGNVLSAKSEFAPRVVITIKESEGRPICYVKGKAIPLEQIRKLVIKTSRGGAIERPVGILLRPDGTICFSQLQEVWREVAHGGLHEIGFDFSKTYGQGKETVIPFTGLPGKMSRDKPLPRLEIEINEVGEILINGALVDDGNDKEMKALTLMLKNQREFRDELIQSGSKTKKQAELIVDIRCNPWSEYHSLAGVFNACMNAGVEHFYPPDFGPTNFHKLHADKLKLMKEKLRRIPIRRKPNPSPYAP